MTTESICLMTLICSQSFSPKMGCESISSTKKLHYVFKPFTVQLSLHIPMSDREVPSCAVSFIFVGCSGGLIEKLL